jgi:hypothetical protein
LAEEALEKSGRVGKLIGAVGGGKRLLGPVVFAVCFFYDPLDVIAGGELNTGEDAIWHMRPLPPRPGDPDFIGPLMPVPGRAVPGLDEVAREPIELWPPSTPHGNPSFGEFR